MLPRFQEPILGKVRLRFLRMIQNSMYYFKINLITYVLMSVNKVVLRVAVLPVNNMI